MTRCAVRGCPWRLRNRELETWYYPQHEGEARPVLAVPATTPLDKARATLGLEGQS